MNKKIFGFLFVITLLFWGSLNYTDSFQEPIDRFFNLFKSSYHNTLKSINDTIEEHFFQKQTIQTLKKKLQQCQQNSLLLPHYKDELKNLHKLTDANISFAPKVTLVRAISYAKFGDLNRLWIESDEYNASKMYGLVYQNKVAGIVIPKNGMPLALLLRDPKSSFAVYIGDIKAPGIAHGNNDENIIATFIPTWYNIEVGDEVITSGLDNLFFEGLEVGKVLKVTTSQGYQKVIIEPYYKQKDLNYFYMILSTK